MTKYWRRNLWAIWFAEFLTIMGFSSTFPIWPYYIQELDVAGEAVAQWSGIIISASALTMGIMGPIWGVLSDRYGRKMMVIRAMFGGAVTIGLMGLVQSVEQMALLRLIQGALTGTVTAATTLVASDTPRERLGETLGKLQLAIFLGLSFGPITGGFIADTLGYRATFWFTAGYLFVAGLIVLFLVHEDFTPVAQSTQGSFWTRLKGDTAFLLNGSLLGLLLGLRFALRVGLRMTTPMVPLIVQELLPVGALLGSASGLLTTVSGIFSAIASPVLGRLGDRHGGRGLLLASALLMAGAMIMQAVAPAYWMLLLAQAFLGLALGGTLAILSAYIGRAAPEGRAGAAFGLDTLAVSLSNAVGPIVGGWLGGAFSLRVPFFVGSVCMLLGGGAVLLLPRGRGGDGED